jgi:hypothetical protein
MHAVSAAQGSMQSPATSCWRNCAACNAPAATQHTTSTEPKQPAQARTSLFCVCAVASKCGRATCSGARSAGCGSAEHTGKAKFNTHTMHSTGTATCTAKYVRTQHHSFLSFLFATLALLLLPMHCVARQFRAYVFTITSVLLQLPQSATAAAAAAVCCCTTTATAPVLCMLCLRECVQRCYCCYCYCLFLGFQVHI